MKEIKKEFELHGIFIHFTFGITFFALLLVRNENIQQQSI